MKNKLTFLCLYLINSLLLLSQDSYHIIPQVQQIRYSSGFFQLNEITEIEDEEHFFAFEQQLLKKELNLINTKAIITKNKTNNFQLIQNPSLEENEYKIEINNKGIKLSSKTKTAMFYAVQTFIQMNESVKNGNFPFVEIKDKPHFNWRGMHLDVSRHFFSIQEVKQYIDLLARYKMNTFHWHLTDDQGWRIEIKKYPLLTSKSAWRNGSMVGHYRDQKMDSIKYGGFYTQEEIKEVVAYAKERQINIVPEIEMPGHALAALSSYPEYSCQGGPFEVAKTWGVFEDVFCAGNEKTYQFLEDILDEVLSLFPSEWIHIGGDECPKTRWKECSKCKKKINEQHLKDEHELQSYFIQRIEKYLLSKGRKIIGWDEILEGGLASNAAVMSWRGTEGGITAAKMKHFVVMSPGKPCYFDHYQSEEIKNEPVAIGGLNTLKMVYDYNPIPESLNEEEKKYILGAQGNVWTEYMNDFKHVQYMILPRMTALAEVLWSNPMDKDYSDFIKRLSTHQNYFEKQKLNYFRGF
ncbi:MAG: beta-N-acetylhexosaminidase [Flavobacteriia bacterium]|nr:beta-N-acetylhexosaminidase [Flavobacteriia bacterium]